MQKLKWSEYFSVGVPELDNQHKGLIDIINTMGDNTTPGTMFDVVMQMFNYAAEHFKTEEALMRSAGYQDLDKQLHEHTEFLDKATDFAARNFNNPDTCAEMISYLRNWLVHHILEVDMKYKNSL